MFVEPSIVRVPHVLEQIGARTSPGVREELEQGELGRGQVDLASRRRVTGAPPGRRPTPTIRRTAGRRAGRGGERAQAREQLAEGEGFDQVVVGARVEAPRSRSATAARGEHQAGAPEPLGARSARHTSSPSRPAASGRGSIAHRPMDARVRHRLRRRSAARSTAILVVSAARDHSRHVRVVPTSRMRIRREECRPSS